MNKKLITLAVAAAMVAPLAVAAETTLYGRIDTAVVYGDDDTKDGDRWDVDTSSTRIGVKGSEDLGNGLKAIFQAEWEFTSSEGTSNATGDENFDNRLGYAGLSGGFGTVSLGRQWTPWYGAINKTNVFNDPAGNNAASGNNIASANKNATGPSRMGNALIYTSPNFNGLSGQMAVFMDRGWGGGESTGIDGYNPAIHYNNGPLSLGVSMVEWDDDVSTSATGTKSEQDLWGVAGSYSFGMFKVIAQYEDKDESESFTTGKGNDDGSDSWAIVGEATFGNNILRAQYGQVDYDDGADYDELDVWAIGLQHNFSARTRVYAEYAANDYDAQSGGTDADKDQFSLGIRHDF